MTQQELQIIFKALNFAAQKHQNQRRKDNITPYINHPIAITQILIDEGKITDPVILAAALLHDTIEDTDATPAELESEFGQEITQIVQEVTDDKSLPKATRKQLQIEHTPHMSSKAQMVKLADKISNLRDILNNPPEDWPLERKQAYFDWANQVIEGLRGVHPELEKVFDQVYAQCSTMDF